MSNMTNSASGRIDFALNNFNMKDHSASNGVINTAAYAPEFKRNADAQVLPFSAQTVNIENHDMIAMHEQDIQIMQVNGTGLNGINLPGGNDSTSYVQALEESLNATFNDGEFQQVVNEHVFPSEFRPFGTEPTPIRAHLLENRTVRFKKDGKFDPLTDAPTAEAVKGSSVMVTPVLDKSTNKSGLLVSASTVVSDFDMMGGWTHGSLSQSVNNMIDQFNRKTFAAIAEVLADTADLQTIEYTKLSGKPQDQAEDVLDALALNLPTHLGSSLDRFALMVPVKLEAVLERAAQKAGHEDLSELLGCTVCPYDGEDTGVYLLPKGFASISFRSTQEGDTVKVIVTREPSKAAFNVELLSVIDVMAIGTVRVKQGTNFDFEADASFPLVHRIQFTK